jgi:hypothetical protein
MAAHGGEELAKQISTSMLKSVCDQRGMILPWHESLNAYIVEMVVASSVVPDIKCGQPLRSIQQSR